MIPDVFLHFPKDLHCSAGRLAGQVRFKFKNWKSRFAVEDGEEKGKQERKSRRVERPKERDRPPYL